MLAETLVANLLETLEAHWIWMVTIAGIVHCLIGTVAAIVAAQKGYSLGKWLVMGWIGGTPALIVALRLADVRE